MRSLGYTPVKDSVERRRVAAEREKASCVNWKKWRVKMELGVGGSSSNL